MKIETKYNIHDKVWLMYLDKPVECAITGILICKSSKGCTLAEQVTYYVYHLGEILRSETSLFDTKEELLKSL